MKKDMLKKAEEVLRARLKEATRTAQQEMEKGERMDLVFFLSLIESIRFDQGLIDWLRFMEEEEHLEEAA